MSRQFWKPHPMGRTCKWCHSQRPGMQPLRLNGERGYWHLKCFEAAKKAAKKEGRNLISTPKNKTGA